MKETHILDMLAAAERRNGSFVLLTPRGCTETDFADLWSRSRRAALGLQSALPTGRVGGLLTLSSETIASLIGCLLAGRDFVSMPLPGRAQDPLGYATLLETIVETANVEAVVVEAAYAGMFAALRRPLKVPIVTAESLLATTGVLRSEPGCGELIQFSSGTTGSPKGVRLDGAAIGASAEATLTALRVAADPEVFCGWVPLSHDMGLIGGLLSTWAGNTRTRYSYVGLSPELFLANPRAWMEACAAHGATVTAAPTFAYEIVARHLERTAPLDLSRLRAAIVGAEPIGVETLRKFAASGSRHRLREDSLCPAYGLAEASLAVSLVPPGEGWSTRTVVVEGQPGEYVSCGQVLDCVTVDAPDVAAGAGPIAISGPATCSGYLPARAMSADGWIRTGDLGAMVGGELVVTGRTDDMLCVAGRNMYAWELERAASQCTLVRAGGCVAFADGRGGYLILFESAEGPGSALEDALAHVRRLAAGVAGIGPSAVGCVARGTLPKTASGKLQRNAIRACVADLRGASLLYREF